MTNGLAKPFKVELFEILRKSVFSLNNIDATSTDLHKFLIIPASYICPIKIEVVAQHIASICLVSLCNSKFSL